MLTVNIKNMSDLLIFIDFGIITNILRVRNNNFRVINFEYLQDK